LAPASISVRAMRSCSRPLAFLMLNLGQSLAALGVEGDAHELL
jgi:hypothetical protein